MTIATGKLRIAFNSLKVVFISNPIGLVITGITLLTTAFMMFRKETDDIVESQKSLNQTITDNAASQGATFKKLQTVWRSIGDDLDKKTKFISENKIELNGLGIAVEGVNDAENIFITNSAAMLPAIMSRAQTTASMELATEKYKRAFELGFKAENHTQGLRTSEYIADYEKA